MTHLRNTNKKQYLYLFKRLFIISEMMYHSCVCIEMQINFILTRFYGGSFLRRLLLSAFEDGGRL